MNRKQKPLPITVNFEDLSRLLDKRFEVDKIDGCGWGLCFTDKTVEVSAEGLENWKASTISTEGKVHHQRGQTNAHPRFQNEESTKTKYVKNLEL